MLLDSGVLDLVVNVSDFYSSVSQLYEFEPSCKHLEGNTGASPCMKK